MLLKADASGYAVPAFNYSDIWDFIAIFEAAEEMRAPIMIASVPPVVNAISPEICGAWGIAAMKKSTALLCHHLDHSFNVQTCVEAIDNGYPSVMIDASKFPLDENIAIVREVVDYAHARNVHVEGEIGLIKGRGLEGDFIGNKFLAEVEDAVELAKQSGLDSMAVGVGTAHGFYEGVPEINFARLKEINDATDVPLVLHGGTGIPQADIEKAIKNGINKINIGTIIHTTYMNAMRAELNEQGDNQYTIKIALPVKDKIKEVVKNWIKVCGADNKA
ncbi:MAG: class II fructose-bisphosphate aldolase [Defluviitaleaceae bacterium]|nr:class II fructose-bisphosphate aldolase [Defluviitaleaceae bacterium]